jgi:hypothetical protein
MTFWDRRAQGYFLLTAYLTSGEFKKILHLNLTSVMGREATPPTFLEILEQITFIGNTMSVTSGIFQHRNQALLQILIQAELHALGCDPFHPWLYDDKYSY